MQALKERYAYATQITMAMLGHDPRCAQLQKMTCFGATREHFIHSEKHLVWLQFRFEVAEFLNWTCHLGTSGSEHALPVGP